MLSDRYVILRRAGRGGMGAVYQASDARISGKTWAVKEMSDAMITDPLERQQAQDAFRQEATMLATLDHPNLPKVTDHFAEGGKQYLVMDFIEGETLKERLEREGGGPFPVGEALDWADQLCDVLTYLHRRTPPVIFRDLKPGNVMVTPEGMIKLIDFGIARVFKAGKAADTAYFGTAGYSPKEQYGKGQTDARSDVYALGAMLHHLLTGVDPTDQPFHFEPVRSLNRGVPTRVADAVAKALADEPADRWQTIAAFQAALKQEQVPVPAPMPSVSAPAAVAAAAQVGAASAKPVPATPAPAAGKISRLNWGSGIALTVLGVVLYTASLWLLRFFLFRYGVIGFAGLVFIISLWGVLFGPWIGAGAGALSMSLLTSFLARAFGIPAVWEWAVLPAQLLAGLIPGLIVRDARDWKAVVKGGIVASVVYVVAAFLGLKIALDWWFDAEEILFLSILVLLPNLIALPLLSRWLVKPVRRWGLYWRDR
jgi:serine/threonine-protein kinase